MEPGDFSRLSETEWRLPIAGKMRVPAVIVASAAALSVLASLYQPNR